MSLVDDNAYSKVVDVVADVDVSVDVDVDGVQRWSMQGGDPVVT